MTKTFQEKVAELSANLPSFDLEHFGIDQAQIEEDILDFISYNSSYYCNGWQRPEWEEDTAVRIIDVIDGIQLIRTFMYRSEYIWDDRDWEMQKHMLEDSEWDADDFADSYDSESHAWCSDLEEVSQCWYDADGNILDLLDHEGIWRKARASVTEVHGIADHSFINRIFKDDEELSFYTSEKGEFLYKLHRDLLDYIVDNRYFAKLDEMWELIKLCHHHKYELNARNFNDWYDTMRMLRELNKDLHNPFFVCPRDLKHTHDWAVRVLDKRREKQRRANKIKKAKEAYAEFMEKHAHLLNIKFDDGKHLFLHSLDSPLEYVEEGIHMHHCVGGYYNNHNSLILSCLDENGNRLSTIEVNMETLNIVQNQGVSNKQPQDYDAINELITKNLPLLKQRMMLKKVA